MASKTNLTTGKTTLDDELDIPDMGFDSPMPKDDRSPVTKAVKGTLSGAASSIKDGSFIGRAVKASLPEGYGAALDFSDKVSLNAKQLYNNAAKEIKPSVAELSAAADKLAPASATRLKNTLGKINKWADSEKANYTSDNKEDNQTAGINASIAETFKFQMEENAKASAREENQNRIQQGLEIARHKDIFGLLNTINQSTSRLSQYQDKVTSAYQKKSLEMQYRSFFVSMDMLEETKKQNALVKAELEGIKKNTGLPEYVKLNESERLGQMLRNKFADSVGAGFMSGRQDIVAKIAKQAGDKLNEKLSSLAGAFSSAAMMAEQAADMKDMAKDMGADMPTEVGAIAGQSIAHHYAGKLGKKVNKHLQKHKGVMLGNAKLKGALDNLPQTVNEFSKTSDSATEETIKNKFGDGVLGKFLSLVANASKEFIPGFGLDGKLEKDTADSLTKPHLFTKQTHKSINEVIPGYLARIYREIQVFRTGNQNTELTVYDLNKNKFVDKSTSVKNAFQSIVGNDDKESTKSQLDDILNEIDSVPGQRLSKGAKDALRQKLLRNNAETRSGGAKRLADKYTYSNDEITAKHADELSSHMGKYFGLNPDGTTPDTLAFHTKQNAFMKKHNALGDRVSDSRATIQNLINLGEYEALESSGIIDKDHSNINFSKLMDYHSGTDFNPSKAAISPVRRLSVKDKVTRRRNIDDYAPAKETSSKEETPWSYKAGSLGDTKDLGTIFEEYSSKQETVKAVDALDRIEKLIIEGNNSQKDYFAAVVQALQNVGSGSGNGALLEGNGNIFQGSNINMKNAFGKAKGLVGRGFNFGTRLAASGISGAKSAFDLGKKGLGIVGNLGSALINKLSQSRDLWMPGEIEPRLTEAGLKAGIYFDQVSGKVIKSLDDIKGAVVDASGKKFFITKAELKESFTKNITGSGIFKIGKSLFNKASILSSAFIGMIPPILKMGLDIGRHALGVAKNFLDRPIDVYIIEPNTVDKLLKVLDARVMENGGYFVQGTMKQVRRPSQIGGAIVNREGKVLLTDEDLLKGIFDYKGRPIKHGLGKLLQMGKSLLGKGISIAKSGFSAAKGILAGGLRGIGKTIGSVTGLGSSDILTKIYNLLDARLPGSGKVGNTVKGVTGSLMAGAGKSATVAAAGAESPGIMSSVAAGGAGAVALGAAKTVGSKLLGGAAFLGKNAFKLGKGLLSIPAAGLMAGLYGTDAILGKLGIGGNAIDENQDDANWDKMTALEKAQSGLARGIEKTAKLLFLDNVANSMMSDRIKNESKYIDSKIVPKESPKSTPVSPQQAAKTAIATKGGSPYSSVPFGSVDAEDKSIDKSNNNLAKPSVNGVGTLVMADGPLNDGRDASKYLHFEKGANLNGVNPALVKNFMAMVAEYGSLTHKGVLLNSGYRSYAEQKSLFESGKGAAPGNSLHEYGLALDVSSSNLNEMDQLGLMRKYGFTRPVGGEPWHLEPAGLHGQVKNYNDTNTVTKVIEASLGSGGGGYGTLEGAVKYSRDGALAQKTIDANVQPKSNNTENPTTIKKPALGSTPDTPSPITLGNSATYDQQGNMISGSIDSETKPSDATATKKLSLKETTLGSSVMRNAGASNASGSLGSSPMRYSGDSSAITAVKNTTPGTGGKVDSLPTPTGAGWSANKDTILGAASMTGVDPKLMTSVAAIESGFNPSAKAKTSSAAGLYQFTDGTWKEMLSKNGVKYGIDPNVSQYDPKANALMGGEYLKQNIQQLGSVKKDLTGTDVYAAHFLGAGGAKKLLTADPSAIAASVLPAAAGANQSIFFDGSRARTVNEVYALLNSKVQSSLQKNGVGTEFSTPPGILQAKQSISPSTVDSGTDIASSQQTVNPNIVKASYTPSSVSGTQSLPTVKPSFSNVVSPMGDIGGFNLNNQSNMSQNPRADMTVAIGDVSSTLKQSLNVQTQILTTLQAIMSSKGTQQPSPIKGASVQQVADQDSTGVSNQYDTRYNSQQSPNVPVRMNRT